MGRFQTTRTTMGKSLIESLTEQDIAWRPRASKDLVFIEVDDGVLVDGLANQQLIRGPLAQTVLMDIVTLLDGTRTVQDVVASFPDISADHIRTAIGLLSTWRLIDADDHPFPSL